MSEIYTGYWEDGQYVSGLDYQKMYEREKQRADTLTHAIMQIRNDLLIENEKLLHEIRDYDLGVYDSNKNAIDRLDTLIGVIEN